MAGLYNSEVELAFGIGNDNLDRDKVGDRSRPTVIIKCYLDVLANKGAPQPLNGMQERKVGSYYLPSYGGDLIEIANRPSASRCSWNPKNQYGGDSRDCSVPMEFHPSDTPNLERF
jgi:hypothetical protein